MLARPQIKVFSTDWTETFAIRVVKREMIFIDIDFF
tara:strand:+ start:727 stop:834 length:108 start_codon:yes stop_codon:yes gene_type:complete